MNRYGQNILKFVALMGLLARGENTSEGCIDVVAGGPYKECFDNVTWAMETGKNLFPAWYADYPILSEQQDFAAYQYVLHDKVGVGGGPGHNCPMPCGVTPSPCLDITNSSPGLCYRNTIWAKTTGIIDYPEYYANFTDKGLSSASSFNDFQWVLHSKVNNDDHGGTDGLGWQCPKPCTSPLFGDVVTSTTTTTTEKREMTQPPTPTPPTTTTTSTTTTTTTEASSSFPWWAWLLSIGGLLLCVGGLIALFLNKSGKSQPQKKKRSTTPKKSVPTPPPAAAPAPAPAVTTAPPVYTQFAQPVQTVQTAQPVYARAAVPVQMAAVPMAAPAQAVAVPMYQYAAAPAAQQASTMFDQMDVNHDGVITRAEFARMMG